MSCDPSFLLEADLETLASALAHESGHLAECATCRADAQLILSGTAALAKGLTLPVSPDVDALLQLAQAPREGSRRRKHMLYAGLAAAAALGSVLLVRADLPRPLPGTPLRPVEAVYAEYEAASEHNLAVLPTRNPDVTVLWFYE